MVKRLCLPFICLFMLHLPTRGQELKANISIISSRIGSQVDKKVFQTLQSALNDFVNNRKWSNEDFKPEERIVCNFLLNFTNATSDNIFSASLTVQAGRPVFNATYESPLVNYLDDAVTFRYVQFQPLDFNEARVQGSEPLTANLTAVFAYYIYIILGMDFDSFSLRGGDTYFQKAQNIVNNAPEGNSISGWKPFDGTRNRYWLIDNFTNAKYTQVHDAVYNYYRKGLDQMYDKEDDGRNSILTALSQLNTVNTDNPNLMFMPFFFQGKASEISNIFKRGTPDEKSRALDYLTKLDISNINRYKQDLQ